MKYNTNIVIAYWRAAGIPEPTPEHRFWPERRFRFDFAWIEQKVALEVQGGIFIQGRHSRGPALLKEWVKLNQAAVMGWRILYCQPSDLTKNALSDTILAAVNQPKETSHE